MFHLRRYSPNLFLVFPMYSSGRAKYCVTH
jgi:hypothetical protein